MKIKVLDRASMGMDISFAGLDLLGEVEIYDATEQHELCDRLADAEICILNKLRITEEVLQRAPLLKLVCVFATGFDNIDVAAARKMGVAVCNVPAYSTDSVALCTVANVLSLFTHLTEYKRHVTSGRYLEEGKANCLTPVYSEMRGKVWGIIGFGNIGSAVARVAAALGAEVIINKRTPIDGCVITDIDSLCKKADIITVHCPLNASTYHLINEERIAMMKKSVILVNEARGAVVDEAAVAKAVLSGNIGAFGSDVYSEEPFSEKHPFRSIMGLDNVCLTPHCAWGAYEARVRCLNIICSNITAFLNGEIKNRVDILGQN